MKYVVAIIVLLVLLVIFQNTDVVTLRFLFWRASLSLVLVLLLTVVIGLLAGFALGRWGWRRKEDEP